MSSRGLDRSAPRWAAAIWPPFAVVALHSVLGWSIGHYAALDPGFHFLGGVAGAYSLGALAPVLPRLLREPAAIVAVVVAAALLWEAGEWASDVWLGTHIQDSWFDTASDIVLGATGALISVRWFSRPAP